MGIFYPQAVVTLRLRPENFGDEENAKLNDDIVFTVLAKQVTVNLNSYREADTFDMTIDYKNFPFDPRIIRSLGVSIFIEDKKKLFRTNNELNLLIPDEENLVFQGFADTDSIQLTEEERTVRLEGRDFTSLLIDQEYLGKPIQTSKPLDIVIRDLLDQLEATKPIKIQNLTLEDLPILANLSADKGKNAGAKNPRKSRSYWDHIQNLVEKAGLIAFISLDTLVITKPRKLYDRSKAKVFVYGANLIDLEFERKLGRQKGFNIRVVSLNFKEKVVIDAKIPEEATEEWSKDIGIKRERILLPSVDTQGKKLPNKEAPFITFRIRDVATKNELVAIGEKIFEEIGRQQIEGKLTTKEMQVCDKDNNFFNSQLFRVGTPIEVSIDQGDLEGLPKLIQLLKASNQNKEGSGNIDAIKGKIKKFLIQRCYAPKVADAFAESLTKFDTPFFTKAVQFTVDQESGWTMEIDFLNFIDLPRSLTA